MPIVRRGFTLIDTAAACAGVGMLACIGVLGLGGSRRSAQNQFCSAKLGAIGAGSAQFSLTHNGRFAGFLSEDPQGRGTSSLHAAEAVAILRSRGRPDMPTIQNWVPDIAYWSLALVEFENRTLADTFNVCPSHDTLNKWRRWPQAFDQGAFLPRQPSPSESNKRWPYSSSYYISASTYDQNQNIPGGSGSPQVSARLYQSGNTHNLYFVPAAHDLGPSLLSSVAFPSMKVHAHEEHQRHEPGRDLYFMYNNARATCLFLDGSVRAPLSGDAQPGWLPNLPSTPQETNVIYSPNLWEPPVQNPVPNPTSELVTDSYRWTRDGLLGWDFNN